MPRAWVELLNRHLEALRDLEAALLATEELGNGGTAEVPALCIGRVWVEGGGWQAEGPPQGGPTVHLCHGS